MQALDLRREAPRDALRSVLAAYGRLKRGEEVAVTLAAYPAGLRMGLVEAGERLEPFPLARNRTGPHPHPATQRRYPGVGGRAGERAGPV